MGSGGKHAARPADASREQARLAEVRRYEILDTPPDGAFDRIVLLASQMLDTPVAIVSIVDADRIWFKAHHGLDLSEVGREPGLCASAILDNKPWVIEDTAIDPRALTNPIVAGQLGLRSYAGAQLVTRDGHNLGMLCVLDRRPRRFTQQQIDVLEKLAAVVVSEMEVRLAARHVVTAIVKEADSRAEPTRNGFSETLSPRERQVLQALAEGLTNNEIADLLSVSRTTVKTHLVNVYNKLGVRNRVEAAAYGGRPG